MKNIQFIVLILLALFIAGCSSKNEVEVSDINATQELDSGGLDNIIKAQDTNLSSEDNVTKIVETNTTIQKENIIDDTRTYTQFEKTFPHHIAYNYYKQAMKLMYEKKHKEAYELAMKAKAVYDNSDNNVTQTISLPYIPGYIRESAQTPRRTYFKIVKQQTYELKRLIRKIKLLNPPIPFVVLNKTSTYIDITVQNFGDTPLDNLIVEVNYEKVAVFDKIYPNASKTIRFDKSIDVEQISFSEEYGFAPEQIDLTQE